MSTEQHLTRIGAVAAIAGSVMLFVATALHPMGADPSDALAAFAEYAADTWWIGSHLGQFFGVALIGAALVALASTLEAGRPAAWARLGVAAAAVSVAIGAALQAVDGIALKAAVDRWAHATGDARALAFEAAFAVRQVEIGLAGLLSLMFGTTAVLFGVALVHSRRYQPWLAYVAIAGGVATIAAGIAQAFSGFSLLAMMLSMPSGLVLIVWVFAMGIVLWRTPSRTAVR